MNDTLPIIYLTDEDYELIKHSRSIEAVDSMISIELIKKILSDSNYYTKVYDFFLGSKDRFGFIYKRNGKTEKIISLKRIDIAEGIRKYLNEQKDISEEFINRYQKLADIVSLPGLKRHYANHIYNITIDNVDYHIPTISLIEFLSRDDFLNIITNSSIKEINGIKKEHFLYAIHKLIIEENIHRNYKLPEVIKHNYTNIYSSIDLEAVNRFTETLDTTYQLIHVDKDLEKAILESIPDDFNALEKSLYLYIKMCKMFSYDEEIYAYNQKGEPLKKHQDYHYISNINLNNRELVCFEYNVLFCYFLNKLGLNFKSNHLNIHDDSYGMGHVNVEYRCGKYLINADSTLNIIYSDLYYAKFNHKLEGIKCLNENRETQKEFSEALTKVYDRIYGKEEVFDDLSGNDISTRLKYLFDAYAKLKKDGLNTMDGVSYFIDLYRNLFGAEERKTKVKVTFVRVGSKINIIVTVNELGVDYIDSNTYYLIIPNERISKISYEDLQEIFDEGIYTYVNEKRDKVPGIKLDSDDVKRM